MKVECKEKRERGSLWWFHGSLFLLSSSSEKHAYRIRSPAGPSETAEDKMSLNSPSLAESSTVSIDVTHQQTQIYPELSLVALNWLHWKNLTTHYVLETTYIISVLDTGKYTAVDSILMSMSRSQSCRGTAYCSRAQRALPTPRDPKSWNQPWCFLYLTWAWVTPSDLKAASTRRMYRTCSQQLIGIF